MKTYVVTPHKNRLDETVLMMGHKICFYGEIKLIITKSSQLPRLIWISKLFGINEFEMKLTYRECILLHYTVFWQGYT